MQTTTRNFRYLVWLWLTTVLVSTMGISVHTIYCYCLGQTTRSLYVPATDDCVKGTAKMACCAEKTTFPCCEKGEKSAEKHNCTQKTTKVFQLKTEFTVGQFFIKKLHLQPLACVPAPVFALVSHSPRVFAAAHFNKAPPPPPISGQSIRKRIQCFRC